MLSEAQKKYKASLKGKLAAQRDEDKNGKARALRYHHSEKGQKTYIKRIFGFEYEDVKRFQRLQNNKCALCGKASRRRLSIDHCHETGKFRGLLCDSCNKGLGLFKDDPELLIRAASYIQKHKENKELLLIIFNQNETDSKTLH